MTDLLGTELSPEKAKIYLAASGPGAWGRMIKGETGTQEEERPEGKFYLGMDYEQEPHSEGVWGEVLASADAYEWPVEVPKEQLNTGEKIYLVASFD